MTQQPITTAPPWQDYELPDRDETVRFRGLLIGSATSQREGNTKLRWFEIDVYTVEGTDEVVVHTRGMSRLAGEKVLSRVIGPTSAVRAIQSLVVHHEGDTYLPEVSQRALRTAGRQHTALREAFAQVPEDLIP